ncbi:inositol monophosphatase family protein [Nocardia altamirensis]|uniref:inositol monophosphatase family protein n=1 Tax=Nocardia altamirensis TaxID=472158 RepID=UPI00084036E6|nr:inositol monophosphatase family protein [Nocardia altamirensis]
MTDSQQLADSDLARVIAAVLPDCRRAIDAWRSTGAPLHLTPGRGHGELVPVTTAQQAVQQILTAAIAQTWPGLPMVTDESSTVEPVNDCVLIGPIDGSESMVKGSPAYAITACRIHDFRPIEAVIALPAYGIRLDATPELLRVHGSLDQLPRMPRGAVLTSTTQQHQVAHWLRCRRIHHLTTVPVATTSVALTLVATGRASAALYLPEHDETAELRAFTAAALTVAASGGTVTAAITGQDLAATTLAIAHGWHALASHADPILSAQLQERP